MNWSYIRISLLAVFALFLTAHQSYADDDGWALVKSNIGTKTFDVSLTLRAKKNGDLLLQEEDPYRLMPAGVTVGMACVTLPGAPSVWMWPYVERVQDCSDYPTSYHMYFGKVFRIIDIPIDDYATGTTRRCYLLSEDDDAQFSVHVSGQADRYAKLDGCQTSDPWRLGIGRRNEAAELMADTSVTYKDVIDHPQVTITLGSQSFTYTSTQTGVSANEIHIEAQGRRPYTIITTTIYPDQTVTSTEPPRDEDGHWILSSLSTYDSENCGVYDMADTIWVEGTYSRSTGVAEATRTFSYSRNIPESEWWTAPSPTYWGYTGTTMTRKSSVTVGGGRISCSGGIDNGCADGWQSAWYWDGYTIYTQLDFTDYCGGYDVDYSRDIKNMDGALRNDVHVMGTERHPVEHVASVTGLQEGESVGHSMHTYEWRDEDYIDLSSGPTIHYSGRWSANAHMPGGSQEYVDMPSSDCTSGPVHHGGLTATNIKDTWDEATSSYLDGSTGEPSHPGWLPWPDLKTEEPTHASNGEPFWNADSPNGYPWYDNQVLVKGSDCGVQNALEIDLASPGDVPDPPLKFYDLSGWQPSDGDTSVSVQTSEQPYYLSVQTSEGNGGFAEIADLLPENIRLTGTRFAKVHWYASRIGAEAAIHVGGHTWNLKAASAGDQTSMIDLCRPDASTVNGDTSSAEPEETAVDSVLIESPDPVGTAWVGYYTAPAYTTSVKFQVDEFIYPYATVMVKDADTDAELGRLYYYGGSFSPSFPGRRFKICVYDEFSGNSWHLKISAEEYTHIDPVRVTASKMQSIIPFDQPLDASMPVLGEPGQRQADSYYSWEYPAGWGVGRVVSVKLECKTPDTEYRFQDLQLYRKTAEEGGFATLYVLPHQPSWNDSRQTDDWSWFDTGRNELPWYENYRHIIRKAHLVVDGAVVLEIPAGSCEEDGGFYGEDDPHTTHYVYAAMKLLPDAGSTGMHVLGYPVDDYTDPTCYATNGVASISTNLSDASDFIKENCCVTYLVGGTYGEGEDHKIRVGLDITPDIISPYIGTMGTVVQGMTKRLRGGAQGLLFDEDGRPAVNRQIRVETPGAPSGQKTDTTITTNKLGWFTTPSLNTKADALLETSVGSNDITTRNRFLSRVALACAGLGNSEFEITSVDPFVIEPAYNDSVNIKWRRTDGTNNAQSLLILKRNDSGAITSTDGLKYDLVHTISLDPLVNLPAQETENPSWNPPSNPYKWIGTVSWQPPADQEAGKYYVGVQYTDSTIQTKWSNGGLDAYPSFNVALSVYDVYSSDCAPFYPGEASLEGKTDIHYSLSSEATRCDISVSGTSLTGPGLAGSLGNTVEWDGADPVSHNLIDTGEHPLSIVPVVDDRPVIVGKPLTISNPLVWKVTGTNEEQSSSFTFKDGEQMELRYWVSEPVRRPQATAAEVTAFVYDESASIVKVLANGGAASIETDGLDQNLPDKMNTLVWDGKDYADEPVPPGNYTIALFAKDNAGVGCESQLGVFSVVVTGDEPEQLNVHCDNDGDDWYLEGTAQPNAVITWSVDGGSGASGVSADSDGYFCILLETLSAGPHSITVTATDAGSSTTATAAVAIFVNTVSVGSGGAASRPGIFAVEQSFDPTQGQSLSVPVNSAADNDHFDAEVIDPFSSDTGNLVDTAARLNGAVKSKPIKKLWDHQTINAGATTLTWDGTDSSNIQMPAGPYIIHINRSDDDPNSTTSFDVLATVVNTRVNALSTPPVISDIETFVCGASTAIAWKTDVPTTGSILYGWQGNAIANVPADDLAKFHVVYLPKTEAQQTYDYWIVARDEAGNTSASEKKEITTDVGEGYGEITVTPITGGECDVQWSTSMPMFGRVNYSKVNLPGIATLSWTTLSETVATQNHSIHLTGLTGDSEYVFRVASADDASFAKAMVSSYQRLVTETTQPSVTIQAPGTDLVISGTVTFSVVASDTVSRFSDGGISSVQLGVDDIILASPSHTAGSNVYEFTLDTTQLKRGIHQVTASAVDDFGNAAECSIEYYIDNTGGYSGQSAGPRTANTQVQASSTKSPLNKQPRGVVSNKTNNGNVEILPTNPTAVLIHTDKSLEGNESSRWPSEYQKEAGHDNQIMVTIKNLDPTNWYRLVLLDPPDLSPYSSRNPGDNIGIRGEWGGPRGYYTFRAENEGTKYEKKAFEDRELPGNWVQLKVKAARDGVARFRLVLRRGQQRGNNYRVKLFHLHGSQKGQMIAESGDIVAWDRVYLEMDHMNKGAPLSNQASAGDITIRALLLGGSPGDTARLNIADNANPEGEDRTATRESLGWWRLDAPLVHGYSNENGSVSFLDKQYDEIDKGWLVPAYGDIYQEPDGQDAGCFVQFSFIPTDRNPNRCIKYHDPMDQSDWPWLRSQYFDNQRSNVVYVACIDTLSQNSGQIVEGLTVSYQSWSWIAIGRLASSLGPKERAAGQTLAHELCHQFDNSVIGGDSRVDGTHPADAATVAANPGHPAGDPLSFMVWDNPTLHCVMHSGVGVGHGEGDTHYFLTGEAEYCQFCRYHLKRIRWYRWP